MKKNMKWLIFGIIFISFSFFTSSVYAFSFDDIFFWVSNFFGKITGYEVYMNDTTTTIETTTTTLLPCQSECCTDPTYEKKVCEYPKTCTEGKCIDTATTTIQTSTTVSQTETTTTLSPCPYECCSLKDPVYQGKACEYPKSCTGNKCVETTTTVQIPCTDSDGGKNYDVKGTAKYQWGEYTDYCSNERQITEYYCQDSGDGRGPVIWTIGAVDCRYGCKDGACLPQPTPVCGNGICETEEEKANCPKDCIKCYQDSECGQSTTKKTCDYPGIPPSLMKPEARLPGVSYACTVETKNTCQNPGTINSQCMGIGGVACKPCELGCQNGECISAVTQTETCTDSDGINYYLKGYVEFHPDKKQAFDTCRVINSNTDYYDTYECSGDNCYVLESSCTEVGTAQSHVWKCPSNICKDGACIKAEEIKEQVKCIFYNSDIITQPTPAKPYEKCYADLRPAVQAVCTSDGNVAEENGKKYLYCLVDVAGEKGTKLAWKSSCGGYAYTVIDGNNENVEFNCIPASNVTEEQIKGKGFRYAYLQCYDGLEQKIPAPMSAPCQSSESWQRIAADFCKNHCYADQSKCGVNSFSVSQECYIDAEEIVSIPAVPSTEIPQETQPSQPTTAPTKGMLYYFRSDDCPHCIDMDTEIGILKQKGFFNDFGAAVFDINDEISQKFEIKAVPTLILYKDGCSFRKEGFIKSDEITNWAYQAKCEEKPILICKDSCPLDEKCYPFSYRKDGKYCSDEGMFKEQLKEDATCENNFECSTNVCVDGKCISSNLIQKIMSWFKKFFRLD
ncbi:MAG: thioredoxin family protein [Candidatus Aenigmarchaeota archaeon]|nr:thioredoxin family protein [Candidatus Aenigmarchaeota archaeon]